MCLLLLTGQGTGRTLVDLETWTGSFSLSDSGMSLLLRLLEPFALETRFLAAVCYGAPFRVCQGQERCSSGLGISTQRAGRREVHFTQVRLTPSSLGRRLPESGGAYLRQDCLVRECRGSVMSSQTLAIVLDHWKRIRAHRGLVALTYK